MVYPFFINVFLFNAKELAAATYDWNRFFVEGGRLASILYDEGSKRRDDREILQPAHRHPPQPVLGAGRDAVPVHRWLAVYPILPGTS